MLTIGCHLSSAKGYEALGATAVAIGANTFQFFTRNPRGSRAKELDFKDVARLKQIMNKNHFPVILAHAPYTMNLCSNKDRAREFALEVFADDLKRMEALPGNYYNFHPGSHVGQGVEKAIEQIAGALNTLLTKQQSTTVLLETMSGKGSEVGRSFEELRAILDKIKQKDKVGVCLDTCHVHDAGYDIIEHLDDVIEQFDHVIGLENLKAIHLNDSLNKIGSRKDRHAQIGQGEIGLEALVGILNHKKLKHLPFYLETPTDEQGHKKEIELLRQCVRTH